MPSFQESEEPRPESPTFTCSIKIDQPLGTVFRPGDKVSGRVNFQHTYPSNPTHCVVSLWGYFDTQIRKDVPKIPWTSPTTTSTYDRTKWYHYLYKDVTKVVEQRVHIDVSGALPDPRPSELPLHQQASEVSDRDSSHEGDQQNTNTPQEKTRFTCSFEMIWPSTMCPDRPRGIDLSVHDWRFETDRHPIPPSLYYADSKTGAYCETRYSLTADLHFPDLEFLRAFTYSNVKFRPSEGSQLPPAGTETALIKRQWRLQTSTLAGNDYPTRKQQLIDQFSKHTPFVCFSLDVTIPKAVCYGMPFIVKAVVQVVEQSDNVTEWPQMYLEIEEMSLLEKTAMTAPRQWNAGHGQTPRLSKAVKYHAGKQEWKVYHMQAATVKKLLRSDPVKAVVQLANSLGMGMDGAPMPERVVDGENRAAEFRVMIPPDTVPTHKSVAVARSHEIFGKVKVLWCGKRVDVEFLVRDVTVGSPPLEA